MKIITKMYTQADDGSLVEVDVVAACLAKKVIAEAATAEWRSLRDAHWNAPGMKEKFEAAGITKKVFSPETIAKRDAARALRKANKLAGVKVL